MTTKQSSPSQKNPPYLSIVIAARNDNYGGHFLHRVKTFFLVLFHYIKKYNLACEIIVVEWNPPSGTKRLYQELQKILINPPVTVRLIEVPHKIHKTILNSDKIPIFEYIAKNVGIRRSRGKFILITNPDILFSPELIQFLSIKKLNEMSFYRVDRYDVDSLIPLEMPVDNKIAFAKTHAFKLQALAYTVPLIKSLPFKTKSFIGILRAARQRHVNKDQGHFEHYIHTNAAGDFILMSRESWNNLGGFPELSTHYLIDGYMCTMAYSSGLQQQLLKLPLNIFHVEHDRPSNRPPTSYTKVKRDCLKMLEQKKPMKFNTRSWGMAKNKLTEHVFHA